ncbi:helix-turn-helix transcriptional regulator [Roseovarius sp. MBR-6]|jgi:transcriptional regulator with XRE-family HTH domain|uniref:helix-turn-helix domain-containing protein n=1 Tax=Roseovarius sp. MBR-6 TaxID=3156459 RepID=UPI00339538DA
MHEHKLDQPAFGIALQRARRRLGLSQSTVATKVGLKQSTVSRIENGNVFQSSKVNELRAIIDDAAKEVDLEGVVANVANSPELRALVARILDGSMHS